jgi:dihydrofolate reductase
LIISIIVAMDEKRGIGYSNRIPWHISLDLQRFKRLTMGHSLIMGRKTWQSIGKPLPGRNMIIITRQKNFLAEGCIVVNSLEVALDIARQKNESEVFIIGGGELFAQTIDIADRLYISYIHTVVPTDIYFPQININEWLEIERKYFHADQKNEFAHTFVRLDKL